MAPSFVLAVFSEQFSWFDITALVLYIAFSLAFGLMVSGKQKDLKTYLLAGHQMHWFMIAVSILAALFSGISFLGAPAETYSHNLVYLWGIVAYFIATPVTAIIFLPFFFRMDFYTAYEYLERRFDLRLRQLSSASFIFRVCLWLALALYAPALVIYEMTGVPLWVSILITGSVTLLYTTIGGMKAVIYTDVMQFGVLLLGIGAVLFVSLKQIPGGIAGAWAIAEAGGRTKFFNWNPSPAERMTVWGAFFGGIVINLVALVTDQVSVQRYLTATSLKESQRALWFKLLITLPLVGVFYLTGLVLYSFYQLNPALAATLGSPDRLLPHFVSRHLASPMPGLLVAAILAATMSTVSSGINSLTTATLIDFLYCKGAHSQDALTERRRVRVARLWTLGYGVIITLLAFVVSRLGTLVEASAKVSGFFGGPLLGIFFLGVLSRRANAKGTLIGAVVGFFGVTLAGFFTQVSFMWYAAIGFVVTYCMGELASRFFAPPNNVQQTFTLAGSRAILKLAPKEAVTEAKI